MTRNFAALAVLVLAGAATHTAAHQHDHGIARPAARPVVTTPMPSHSGPLPPMPGISFEPSRPLAVIEQVYEFAARRPGVLQYVPCYCGCEREGHNGSHDCFVKSRASNGRVIEWNTHGIGCTICIDVARDAMALHAAGATVEEIRSAIDEKYGTRYPSSTATPRK